MKTETRLGSLRLRTALPRIFSTLCTAVASPTTVRRSPELEREVGGGQKLHARAVNAADVDAVKVSQAQRAELAAVDFGAGDQDALRDKLPVNGVPVDVARVPVLFLLPSEDQVQGLHLLRRGDDKQVVALLQGGVRRGDRHAPLAPQSGDDESVVAVEGYVADAFAENRRIGGAEFGDKDIFRVVGVGRGKIRGTDDKPPEQGDGQDDPHHSQRVGYRASEGCAVAVEVHLLEGLLRGARAGVLVVAPHRMPSCRAAGRPLLAPGRRPEAYPAPPRPRPE